MSSYKYSPLDVPSGSKAATTTIHHDNDHQLCSSMLMVAPFFHFLMDPLLAVLPSSVLACIIAGATAWRRLMRCRLFPCSTYLPDITVAHFLLTIPMLVLCVSATDLALFRPTSHHALTHSGKMASYAMTATFVTASKSHSLISLVTGLSFDRLINFHLASALLTLWMCLLHGVQIAYFNRGETTESSHHDDHDHDDEDHDEDEDHHHHSHSHSHSHDEDHDHDDHDHDDRDHEHQRFLHHDSIHAYLGTEPNLWKFFFDGDTNTSGFTVLVALSVLVVTSVFHGLFRKWWFEGWLVAHLSGALVVLLAGLIHGADIFVFAIIWWVLDLFIRYGVMAMARYPRQAKITRVAENVTKIQWRKTDGFQYEAGQFVQVAVPGVRMWQFHPFSIASNPEESFVTLYVRALPGAKAWTRQLYEFAAPRDANKISTSTHRVFVEGPYGTVPSILDDSCTRHYSMAILISGGIGVTPCHSIAKRLIAKHQPALQKIHFIWSVRDEGMIKAIPPPKLEGSGNKGVARINQKRCGDDNGIELVEHGIDADETSAAESGNDALGEANDDVPSEPSLKLQTDIYISQMVNFVEEQGKEVTSKEVGSENSSSLGRSHDTTNPYTIHRGSRPDVHAIIKEAYNEALREGWGRLFVMGCGPVSLREELLVACQNNRTKTVQIDFHEEIFDY